MLGRSQKGALMELSLATRSVSDHLVLEIGGEIDVYTAPRLRERLLEMVNSGEKHIVVDLGRVEFLDSTGLGVLVGAHRRLRARDGSLNLVCPHDACQGLPDHRTGQHSTSIPPGGSDHRSARAPRRRLANHPREPFPHAMSTVRLSPDPAPCGRSGWWRRSRRGPGLDELLDEVRPAISEASPGGRFSGPDHVAMSDGAVHVG
jgi:anti-sigma B factor antagonist